MKKYKDFPPEIQEVIKQRVEEQGNTWNPNIKVDCDPEDGGFNWEKTVEGWHFWDGVLLKEYTDLFYKKYPKKEEGKKFSGHKLPWYKVLFSQFPLALEEIIRCSNAGHLKYLETDKDWQNFSRVPNAKEEYKNAALRHLKESETHIYNEDMKEFDPKVRHLAQSCWNLISALEVELRHEKGEIYRYTKEDTEKLFGQNTSAKMVLMDVTDEKPKDEKTWLSEVEKRIYSEMKDMNDSFPDKIVFYGNPLEQHNGLTHQLKEVFDKNHEKWKKEEENYDKMKEYFQRPTLSVDELLDRNDYNDFPEEDSIG